MSVVEYSVGVGAAHISGAAFGLGERALSGRLVPCPFRAILWVALAAREVASTEEDSPVETKGEANAMVWVLQCRCSGENFVRQLGPLIRPWSPSWYCPDDRRYLSRRFVLPRP